jgi:glycine C-acetyltransferase
MSLDEIADEKLAKIEAAGTLREMRELSGAQGPRMKVAGREVLLFAGSNYLDLSHHPQVVAAAAQAVEEWGCASGGSRLISGNLALHEELEASLARFCGTQAALCFNSGYAANLGVIPALVGPGDCLISDALNHASIIDGAKLSGASIRVFPHGDLDILAETLAKAAEEGGRRLLALDGVFSMDGDVAPLVELVALARRYDTMVLLDDAHGTATLGHDGRGSASHCGVTEGIDIYLGNLAKGLGSFGAFVAGSHRMRELLVNVARSFIFTCALPPAQVAAAGASLALSLAEPWRRVALQRNAARLRERLARAGISCAPSTTHIVPVVTGENTVTMRICEALLERGYYVQGIRHPSVPRGSARLRITPMATHREEEIDALAGAVSELVTSEVGPLRIAG